MTNITRSLRIRRIGIAVAAFATLGLSTTTHATVPATPRPHPADPGAGQTERISFSPGTDGATLSGAVLPGQDDRYVLRAGAGQTLSVAVAHDALRGSIGVFAPDGTELSVQPNPGFEGVLPATGDYTITVHVEGDPAPGSFAYTLTVRIPAGTTSCSTTQRIRFAPGSDHGTVSGAYCEGQDNRFVLRAGAGQTMTVTGIEAGTAFSVIAPDGSTLPGGPGETISYSLPASGDYTIVHGRRRSEVTSFEFTVTIPRVGSGDPGAGQPTRVRFPAGAHGTSLHDSVASGGVDRFVLWAAAGQRMAVHVDAAADNATITITAPDGTVLSSGETQPVIDSLPGTGDYTVEVHPSGGGATYQIGFWIR